MGREKSESWIMFFLGLEETKRTFHLAASQANRNAQEKGH